MKTQLLVPRASLLRYIAPSVLCMVVAMSAHAQNRAAARVRESIIGDRAKVAKVSLKDCRRQFFQEPELRGSTNRGSP